jgi:hypothetical protein
LRGGGDLEHRLGRRGGAVGGGEDLLEAARAVADSLTTQQAAMITVVDLLGTPSLSQAATALGTTHQNARGVLLPSVSGRQEGPAQGTDRAATVVPVTCPTGR